MTGGKQKILPEIEAIWNRNKYLKRKYNTKKKYELILMYPCKRVIWRLDKLMEDLNNCNNMEDLDNEYWNQIKPKIEECLIIADSWRRAERRLYGRQITQTTKTKQIAGL